MAINFPNSPSTGDTHVANNITWTYDGSSWRSNEGVGATVTVSDDPPSSPDSGDMWWESDTGKLKVYYNDGTSFQWVDASPQGSNEYVNLSVSGSLDAGGVNVTGVTTSVNVAVADSIGVGLYGQGTGIGITFESNGNATFTGIITAVAIQDPAGNSLGGGGGASVTVSDNPPTSPTPSQGDLWWESDTGRLKVYYEDGTSNQWVDATPQPSASSAALQFNGNTKVEATNTGAVVTGILTAISDNPATISGINVGMGGTVLPGTTTHDETNTGVGRAALFYAKPGGAAPLDGKNNTGVGYNVLGFGTGGTGNTGLGALALAGIGSTTVNCTAIGYGALYFNRGNYNTAVGKGALYANGRLDDDFFGDDYEPGAYNCAFGLSALAENISGKSNSAIGAFAVGLNTNGGWNNAMGLSALYNNKSGSYGTAIGHRSQEYANDTLTPYNNYNVSLGAFSLQGTTTPSNNTGNQNTAIGYASQQYHANGESNTSVGHQSLSNNTGNFNTAIGSYSLAQKTSGESNTSVGYASLYENRAGERGVAFGHNAGRNVNNTTTTWTNTNTYIGWSAGYGSGTPANNTGLQNTVLGYTGLYSISSGERNTAIGNQTGVNVTTGSDNTLVGSQSGLLMTIADGNVVLGSGSAANLVDGDYNTLAGTLSGNALTGGGSNTAFGYATLYSNKAGEAGVAFGYRSQFYANDSTTVFTNQNTSVGYKSLEGSSTASNNTGNQNTALGWWTLQANSTGQQNTAIGSNSMEKNTTGSYNCSLGYAALYNNLGGENNTALGRQALFTNNSGSDNTMLGAWSAYYNTSGSRNTALGWGTLQQRTTIDENTAVGYRALQNGTAGFQNVAMGYDAGKALNGDYNTAIGSYSIYQHNGTGNGSNTAIGYAASGQMQSAIQTTSLGAYSGYYGWAGSGQSGTGNYNNCTNLGYNSSCSAANQVNLGNTGTTTYVWGSVANRSDERDKTDIRDTLLGLDFIKSLRPVDFRWDYRDDYFDFDPETHERTAVTKDGSRKRTRFHHGLIAQEVKSASDSLGIDFAGYQDHKVNGGGDVLTIGYSELIAPLIKSVQELSAENAALKARLDAAGL